MSLLANSIEQSGYWLKLSVCINEYINPALLDVLHNDGPNPDPTYVGIPRDPKLLYIYLSEPESLHFIEELMRHDIINQCQYELLFPPGFVETDSHKV